ncbi:MAG: [protein-PII] uridylyltransferase [Ectothiorhodospiraceae bacterium]|nr:[protein-PII] uridylyltransferase [Ectothiorhodospiraceae bacterium]
MSDSSAEGMPLAALPPAQSVTGAAAAAALRQTLADADRELLERHESGVPACALVRQRAAFVDRLLALAWTGAGLEDDAACLVAVGGYGRHELHPHSDVDVLILLAATPSPPLEERLRAFLTTLWDAGLAIGHGVRTVEECAEVAAGDVSVATTLMEARRLTGPEALYQAMRAATGPDRIWPSRDFFAAKRTEQATRHHRFHDTAYNLEPNVKESPGGLRDIQTVGWVAKRHFGVQTLEELHQQHFLTESELRSLLAGQDFLWELRFAMHVLAGRREDRLLFDLQRRLAARFGYLDDDANLAVEKLMQRYYRTAIEVARLNEMLLELFEEAILHADHPRRVEPISRRFRAVNGYLEAIDDGVFRRYPYALLELFLLLERRPELDGVRASTIRLVRDHRYLVDRRFRGDIRARSLFAEIMRQPHGVAGTLRRMHRYGVLGAYLPEFDAVVGKMQYDLFHAYTVDEHSLFVVANVNAMATPAPDEADTHCAEIYQRLPKPELLSIAALFHDLAKGRGGDHSELGADDAVAFCERHEMGPYDTRLVEWLVRHHLLMSVTAQRRDIYDPEVVREFARLVGDRNHLRYLYLLTVADIRGTNPKLWNDWKARLLRDLFVATERALRLGLEAPVDREALLRERQEAALALLAAADVRSEAARALWAGLGEDYFLRHRAEEIAWHTAAIVHSTPADLPLVIVRPGRGGTDVFVYARDQEFLFAATTSVLGRQGLDIVDARIITADNGMTLDSYVVLDLDANPLTDPGAQHQLARSLAAALEHPSTARDTGDHRMLSRRLRSFRTVTDVAFEPDDPSGRSVMVVTAADRPGLLARIGWALADADVRLQNAKIATFGERAEDVFYVTDATNRPLPTARARDVAKRVRDAIEAA